MFVVYDSTHKASDRVACHLFRESMAVLPTVLSHHDTHSAVVSENIDSIGLIN